MEASKKGDLVERSALPGLVLWDFDGTLANTCDDVWGSLRYAADRIGRSFSPGFEDDSGHLALPISEIVSALEPPVPLCEIASFERDVRVHYRSISTHPHTRLYTGVAELLGLLARRGVKSFIVTNKPREALERLLSLKGWTTLFDGWVASDMGKDGDYSKDQMIRIALAQSGVNGNRAVMVGDSWGDVRGAHSAGVACIGVTYGDGDKSLLLAERPDFIAGDVAQVAAILVGETS